MINWFVDYLVFDIETGFAPDEELAPILEKAKPAANIRDPAKRLASIAEAQERIREKSALVDCAPVLCIVSKTPQGLFTHNWMTEHSGVRLETEKEMLIAFREFANQAIGGGTKVVGHNIISFDVPKLRNRYVKLRLSPPKFLAVGQQDDFELVDTAKLFRAFSSWHRDDFCTSLDNVCISLGIPRHKAAMSGKEVPQAHLDGRYEEILTYCALDVLATEMAFQLMSGNTPLLV